MSETKFPTGNAWLLSYQKKYWGRLVLGTLFVLCSTAFSVFVPNQVGKAIDDLKHSGVTYEIIARHALLIVGASLISGVFLYFQRRTLINMSRFIEYDLRNDFYAQLQRLPLQFYQDNRTGDLMARATNDLGAVRQIVGPAIMYGEQTIFRCLIVVPIMFAISWKLTLILLITMPLVSLCVKWFGEQIHIRFEKIQAFFSDISARAQENLNGVRVIRAYAQEEAEIATFDKLNQQYVDRNLDLVKLSAVFRQLMQFLICLGFEEILWFGGRETALGRMTLGEFASFNLYLEQLIWPLIAMGYVTNLVQRGTASLKRMHEIMQVEPAIADSRMERDGERGEIEGRIEFRFDVSLF
ncbi:MAG: ABC transporter transmembrane domain-containing protein [Blastocatellia bacterium]